MPSSWTRPPIDEEGEEIGCADGAVAVEVGGAAFARPPTCQQREEIGCAYNCVVIKIPRAWQDLLDSLRSHRTENPAPLAVQPKENRPPLDGRCFIHTFE